MANKEAKNKNDKKNSFKSFKAELKKVIWPTPKQLLNNTMAVLAIVVIVTAIVFVLDIVFESANKYGINKIKETIVSTNTVEENTTANENETEDTNANNETNENAVEEENTSNTSTTQNTVEQTNSAE